MSPAKTPRPLDEIRAQNHRHYGTPAEAREYAEDHGAVFCADCHGVFERPDEGELKHPCAAPGAANADFDNLSEDALDDMGMYRCACGAAVYPGGDGAPHCALDDDRS